MKIFFMNGTVLDQPFLDVRDRLVRIDPTYDERGLLFISFRLSLHRTGGCLSITVRRCVRASIQTGSCTNHLSEFRVSDSDPNRVICPLRRSSFRLTSLTRTITGGHSSLAPLTGISTCLLGTEGVRTIPGSDTPRVCGNAQDLTKILGKIDPDRYRPHEPGETLRDSCG